MTIDLKARWRIKLREKGASFFGIADLTPAKEFIVRQGGQFLSKYPRAISIGHRLMDAVVDELQNHHDSMAITTYRYHIYEVVNRRLDDIALDIAQELQQEGYRAMVIPSAYTVDYGSLTSVFPHKLAAHLAGVGWIGKSTLLITPECGPRARWCTVMTNAPLKADQPFQGEQCGGCTLCVDNCPPHALSGTPFDIVRPRGELFAAEKCWEYMKQRQNEVGVKTCGMCVYVCPHGRNKAKLQSKSK